MYSLETKAIDTLPWLIEEAQMAYNENNWAALESISNTMAKYSNELLVKQKVEARAAELMELNNKMVVSKADLYGFINEAKWEQAEAMIATVKQIQAKTNKLIGVIS